MAGRKIKRFRSDVARNENGAGTIQGSTPANDSGESIVESDDSITDGNVDGASSDIDSQYTDPASLTDTGSDTGNGTSKRRGRKPGSRNKSTAAGKSSSQATADISGILFTLHLVAAQIVKNDILAITKEESEQLGAAITRVTELYDVPLLNEKHMAIVNLLMVSGGIYGTRFIAASMMHKKKQAEVITMPFEMAGQQGQQA